MTSGKIVIGAFNGLIYYPEITRIVHFFENVLNLMYQLFISNIVYSLSITLREFEGHFRSLTPL